MAAKKKTAGETTGSGKNNGETYTDRIAKGIEVARGKKLTKVERQMLEPKSLQRGYKSLPTFGQLVNMEAGDNTKVAQVSMRLFLLPDIDMNDVHQVAERIGEYYQIYADADMKPTVSGMAAALNGQQRRWLWAVVNDQPLDGAGTRCKLKPEVVELIRKSYRMLECQWEGYTTAGKINPIPALFIAKNNFNYVDRIENVVVNDSEPYEDLTQDTISERYD